LESLYGAQAARRAVQEVRQLLDDFRPRLPRLPQSSGSQRRLGLTQRDALLIAYGDAVHEEGRAPLRTLREFCENHLRQVISGIHLLPHFPSTSDDGFSVTDYFAVNPALGSWEDVTELGRSFDLMFDAVFNHMSAQSEWFLRFLRDEPEYRNFFVTVEGHPDLSQVVRPRALPLLTEFQSVAGPRQAWTTFSADQVDLNFKNPGVLLAMLRALLFYIERGARFIRLDAIAYLWKNIGTPCIHLSQTHQVIQVMRAVLDEIAPHILLITETNVPHTDNISYFGDGTNEAQLVYNFALPPLVMHALLRGDATYLTRWAQSLALPSDRVAFFNFLASHDGIGLNPARGLLPESEIDFLVERCQAHGGFISYKHTAAGSKTPYEMNIVFFDAVNNPSAAEPLQTQVDRFLVSQAILLALRGLPGIYFHSLFGSHNDREAALSTGISRRINRQKLSRARLEAELMEEHSVRACVFSRYQDCLRVRRNQAAFHPNGGEIVLACDPRVFALLRTSPDGRERVLCLHNVSREAVAVSEAVAEFSSGDTLTDLLNEGPQRSNVAGRQPLTLRPYQVTWIKAHHGREATTAASPDVGRRGERF
jgi:sucrose phosphorylase